MKLGIYSIYDKKAEAFMRPFLIANDAMAQRDFAAVIQNAETPMGKFSEDFVLYRCGEFDDREGSVSPLELPVIVVTGLALAKLFSEESE